jgi:hypothetical protein
MFEGLRRTVSSLRGRRAPEDPLVKVAGTIHEVEVDVWRTALTRQGLAVTVRELPPEAAPPLERPSWELWVRLSDEPRARLILGLSGHSVIRLPRPKKAEEQ